MTEKRTAIILAGGESKRFGQPKALLRFGDKLIIEIIIAVSYTHLDVYKRQHQCMDGK